MTKPDPSIRADDLLKTSQAGAFELQDDALDEVAGGAGSIADSVSVNKAKTADKASKVVDAYIRS